MKKSHYDMRFFVLLIFYYFITAVSESLIFETEPADGEEENRSKEWVYQRLFMLCRLVMLITTISEGYSAARTYIIYISYINSAIKNDATLFKAELRILESLLVKDDAYACSSDKAALLLPALQPVLSHFTLQLKLRKMRGSYTEIAQL